MLAVQFLGHKRQQEAGKKLKFSYCKGTQFHGDNGSNLYPSYIIPRLNHHWPKPDNTLR